MKNLNKFILVLATASIMATSVFAASNESPSEELLNAKGRVEALSTTLENMGENVNSSVDLNGAYTFNQKTAVYNDKHAELQAQFDTLRAQTAE